MNIYFQYPDLFNIRDIRKECDELADIASLSRSDTDIERIEALDTAIDKATPILRLCDKVKALTGGRLVPILRQAEGNPLEVGAVVFVAGSEGPQLYEVKGAGVEDVLKLLVLSIEITNGVPARQRVAA